MQILKRARQIKRCFSQKNLKTWFFDLFFAAQKILPKEGLCSVLEMLEKSI